MPTIQRQTLIHGGAHAIGVEHRERTGWIRVALGDHDRLTVFLNAGDMRALALAMLVASQP